MILCSPSPGTDESDKITRSCDRDTRALESSTTRHVHVHAVCCTAGTDKPGRATRSCDAEYSGPTAAVQRREGQWLQGRAAHTRPVGVVGDALVDVKPESRCKPIHEGCACERSRMVSELHVVGRYAMRACVRSGMSQAGP